MLYVALLRGINVGGKSKVAMTQLKAVFESAGCVHVVTYINSGNIMFEDNRSQKELTKILEAAIQKGFGFHVPIVLRSAAAIQDLCEHIPAKWMNDGTQKTDVLFLWEAIDNPEILKQISYRPEIERVQYLPGAIVWNIDRNNATRSGLQKIIGTELYRQVTIRNINTVRKLDSLMKARKSI